MQGKPLEFTLPCDSTIIFEDTLGLKNQISRPYNGKQIANFIEITGINTSDFDSIISIAVMQVFPSGNDVFDFIIHKKEILLYIPTEGGLYIASLPKPAHNRYSVGTKRRHGRIIEMMRALGNPSSCVFSLSFLPKDRYYYPAIGYVDGSKNIFIDEQLNRYESIEELIIGIYGSIEQYKKIYANELYWRNIVKYGSKEERDSAFGVLRYSYSNDTTYAEKLLEIYQLQR